MNEAIKLAIDGGWENKISTEYGYRDNRWQFVVIDPLFWQALGKSLELDGSTYSWQIDEQEKWITLWHRFIDHLISSKDIESFFKELIANKK